MYLYCWPTLTRAKSGTSSRDSFVFYIHSPLAQQSLCQSEMSDQTLKQERGVVRLWTSRIQTYWSRRDCSKCADLVYSRRARFCKFVKIVLNVLQGLSTLNGISIETNDNANDLQQEVGLHSCFVLWQKSWFWKRIEMVKMRFCGFVHLWQLQYVTTARSLPHPGT